MLRAVLPIPLALALALPALAQTTPLNGNDIRATVIGNTVTGDMGGLEYTEFYDPDGAIRGRGDDGLYDGAWTIEGDRMCFSYGETADCYRVAVSGASIGWLGASGEVAGTGTLLPGNPDGL